MRDDDDKPSPDSDRAAILARRKQFVALALSGLATTACTTGTDKADDDKAKPNEQSETKPAPLDEVPPHPCLKIAPPEDNPNIKPQACLKIAPPDPVDETGETGAALDEPKPEPPPEPKPKPKPRPCLRKAAPRPCLMVAE